jgi:hypothetical protein
MATIEDLNHKPLSEMSTDEAIDLLRQIRLSRRTQKKPTKRGSASKKPTKAGKKELTPLEAKKILEILGG